MTASDSLEQLERRATGAVGGFRAAIAVVLAIVALDLAYCAGSRTGGRAAKVAAFDARRDTLRDTIKVVEERIRTDTIRLRVTSATAQTARARFDSAETRVLAIADTATTVATAAVLPALHACDQAIVADSLAFRAQAATLTDMTRDRDAWKARATTDEQEILELRPRKLGFRSGLAAGAGAVIAFVLLVR